MWGPGSVWTGSSTPEIGEAFLYHPMAGYRLVKAKGSTTLAFVENLRDQASARPLVVIL
jgi:hypothetical protein